MSTISNVGSSKPRADPNWEIPFQHEHVRVGGRDLTWGAQSVVGLADYLHLQINQLRHGTNPELCTGRPRGYVDPLVRGKSGAIHLDRRCNWLRVDQLTIRRRTANATASVRLVTPSLERCWRFCSLASKKGRTKILDEFVATCGYHQKHTIALLRGHRNLGSRRTPI